jgi:cob(I)alamin adenosyltransferase
MAKHTRIYTRTGDDGTTGLYSGARVPKNDLRIEAYGTVDELSSAIGVARVALGVPQERIDAWLAWTQDVLFNLGAELATPSDSPRATGAVSDGDVTALERAIDESEAGLDPLDTFIHPGGSLPGALLHLARTICRRAERRVLSLRERDASVDPLALRYLNRLSDALFVWARATNAALGEPERRWRKEAAPPR